MASQRILIVREKPTNESKYGWELMVQQVDDLIPFRDLNASNVTR
jgi:hypothetical protein